jgi:serine phosphatase RsbU (regulator of sigma subunit)
VTLPGISPQGGGCTNGSAATNPGTGWAPPPGQLRRYRVLLIEADPDAATAVGHWLGDSDSDVDFEIVQAGTLASGLRLLNATIDCAVVDLDLPDARGLLIVSQVLDQAPDLAVVVLTGSSAVQAGRDAVAAGAQDYLVKDDVDGRALVRSLRYGIERAATKTSTRRLLLAEQRQQENERLARGLLPAPLVPPGSLRIATRYQPGGSDALLGGDFFDAVQQPDGTVRLIIGDVCGHGPDEAAIGVALRISWRSLILAGANPTEALAGIESVLANEAGPTPFVTVCDAEIRPDRRSMVIRLCGHPAPLLLTPDLHWLEEITPRLPLGLGAEPVYPHVTIPLPPAWSMLLFTDGIYEGRRVGGRLGIDGLLTIAAAADHDNRRPEQLLDRLIASAETAGGAGLTDDVALMWIGTQAAT